MSCETPFQKGNFQAFIPENRSQLLLQGHFQRPFVLISDFLPFQLSSPALCKRLQGKALPTKRWIRGFGALSTASFLLLIPVGALRGTRDSWGKQENRPPAPPSPLPPFPSAARPPELLQPHSPLRGRRRAGAVVPTRLRGAHRGPILLKSPPRDRTSGSRLRGTHSDAVSPRLPATRLFLRCSNFERYLRLFAKSPSPNLPSLLPAQLQRAEEPAPSLLRAPVKEACTYLLAFSIGNSFPWQFCRETPPQLSSYVCSCPSKHTKKKKAGRENLEKNCPLLHLPHVSMLHAQRSRDPGPFPVQSDSGGSNKWHHPPPQPSLHTHGDHPGGSVSLLWLQPPRKLEGSALLGFSPSSACPESRRGWPEAPSLLSSPRNNP